MAINYLGLDRVSADRPIPVSGIGRYSQLLVGIGIGRYLFEHRRQYP